MSTYFLLQSQVFELSPEPNNSKWVVYEVEFKSIVQWEKINAERQQCSAYKNILLFVFFADEVFNTDKKGIFVTKSTYFVYGWIQHCPPVC